MCIDEREWWLKGDYRKEGKGFGIWIYNISLSIVIILLAFLPVYIISIDHKKIVVFCLWKMLWENCKHFLILLFKGFRKKVGKRDKVLDPKKKKKDLEMKSINNLIGLLK